MMSFLRNERLVALIGGTVATVALAMIAWDFGLTQNRRIFDFEANTIRESIFERIQVSDAVAKSLQALFHSSLFVDSDQFLIVAGELIRRYPYILSVTYCPRIRAQDRIAFEAEQELWGIVGFRIFEYAAGRKAQAAERPYYFPIIYREPLLAKDTMALGYDLLSSEALTPTITRAIAEGAAIPSPLVTLAETPGYQVIIAVYEGKHVPATSEKRAKSVNGLLCLTLSPEAFLTNTPIPSDIMIRLENLSVTTDNEGAVVFAKTPMSASALRQLFSVNFVTVLPLQISVQHFRLTIGKRLDIYAIELWLVALTIVVGISGSWSTFVILRSRALLRQELRIRQTAERHLQQVNAELDQLNAGLEQRVQERTAELQALNEELNSFAHIVSHDLKAPLRNITQLVTWLTSDYAASFDAEGKQYADLLLSRVKRMDNLISGVLEYSRVGRMSDNIEAVDLHALLLDVLDTLAPPPHIHIALPDALPTVMGDKIRLVQVFQNLIGNAIKFMDKPQGEIAVGCVEAGEFWQFSVKDNGPGIAPQYQEKIFQIFQTLRLRDEQESTGVGLTIVKKIVEWYGGKIWVESTENEGSAFVWTFPKVFR